MEVMPTSELYLDGESDENLDVFLTEAQNDLFGEISKEVPIGKMSAFDETETTEYESLNFKSKSPTSLEQLSPSSNGSSGSEGQDFIKFRTRRMQTRSQTESKINSVSTKPIKAYILKPVSKPSQQEEKPYAKKYSSNYYDTDSNVFHSSMTKAALAAREQRQKKKNYVKTLEETVHNLKEENAALKKSSVQLSKSINELSNEVKYLKSVLANESTLSSLLANLPLVTNSNGLAIPINTGRKRKHYKRVETSDDDSEIDVESTPKKASKHDHSYGCQQQQKKKNVVANRIDWLQNSNEQT
ncbi:DgyrCDS7574 [Dimorphilus gyrociliatus]|uniref:DgyrCDS7574 n=1 Tax=Dimorphilus gyrociliatus TaxID=2664684 RepID=A0A7I8VRK5_9ANNE|nr:DgyrCDS7574 [Dimorphilus gyrociliatus]